MLHSCEHTAKYRLMKAEHDKIIQAIKNRPKDTTRRKTRSTEVVGTDDDDANISDDDAKVNDMSDPAFLPIEPFFTMKDGRDDDLDEIEKTRHDVDEIDAFWKTRPDEFEVFDPDSDLSNPKSNWTHEVFIAELHRVCCH